MVNYQDEIEKIAEWLREYNEEAGTSGYVVGLSGGVDSSVAASIAVRSMGKEKIIGVQMSCETRGDMESDALMLALNLDIHLKSIPLTKAFENIKNSLMACSQNGQINNELTLMNLKARLRMATLYAIGCEYNKLVMGTGNLSEISVGYFTKHGDGGVDLEPLGNYYKTEIYRMAELMPEIPKNVKTKAPTADLKRGQTDEEELGIRYAELDVILKALADGDNKILDQFPASKLELVQNLIKKAKHKNNLPPRYIRV